MRDLQEQVRLFCLHHGMTAPPEHRLLDVQSELGEVAKEMLKATDYGREPPALTDGLLVELGDLAFALLQLGNALNVDLETEIRSAMKKYEKRIGRTGSAGSTGESIASW